MRPLSCAACLLLLAAAAFAEIYRCRDSAGRTRFTGDPSSCTEAAVVEAPRELIRTPSATRQPASPGVDRAPGQHDAPDLASLFPAAEGDWEIVHEAPEAPDPELRSHGLGASQARHYTRARGPVSEVCSVELWAFDRADQARGVAASLARPGWQILRADSILVLLHGVRLERGVGTRKGLVDGCAEIGERARAAAAG